MEGRRRQKRRVTYSSLVALAGRGLKSRVSPKPTVEGVDELGEEMGGVDE